MRHRRHPRPRRRLRHRPTQRLAAPKKLPRSPVRVKRIVRPRHRPHLITANPPGLPEATRPILQRSGIPAGHARNWHPPDGCHQHLLPRCRRPANQRNQPLQTATMSLRSRTARLINSGIRRRRHHPHRLNLMARQASHRAVVSHHRPSPLDRRRARLRRWAVSAPHLPARPCRRAGRPRVVTHPQHHLANGRRIHRLRPRPPAAARKKPTSEPRCNSYSKSCPMKFSSFRRKWPRSSRRTARTQAL